MPYYTRWRDLRIGIAAALAVAAISVAVLLFARVGALRGDTFKLFVRTSAARGLMKGSEVWVGGQRVGLVSDIHFLPPSADGSDPLLIETDVLERHRQAIRHDSRAEIRAGARLIAAPVVAISPGSARARVVRDGDTITARGQADLQGVTTRFGDAAREFPAVVADVKRVTQQLQSPGGTIGAFGTEGGAVELAAVRERGGRIAASLSQGRGTLGRLLGARAPLQARAQAALAQADSVRQLLNSPETALGRFRRDTTLQTALRDIQNELSIVRALMTEARGSAGRFTRDSAIVESLTEAEREMGAIMQDVRRRPFRYLSF